MKRVEESCEGMDKVVKAFRAAQESRYTLIESKIGQILGRLDKIQDNSKEHEDYVHTTFKESRQEELKMKEKLAEIDDTYMKIVKQGHRCADFQQNTRKEAKISSQKISDMSDALAELKTAGKKELEEQLQKNCESIEEVRRAFDQKVREAAKQASEQAAPMTKKTAKNRIFFTGLMQIQKKEKLDGDITTVIHNILLRVGCSPYYMDIIAIHPKGSLRSSACNAIVYFQSTYHKIFAAAEIRHFLAKERIKGSGLRDLFLPGVAMETSKELTAKGFELKKKGVIQKFCIDNWAETF